MEQDEGRIRNLTRTIQRLIVDSFQKYSNQI